MKLVIPATKVDLYFSRCDDCGAEELPKFVQLGQEPDWESSTANVCFVCLKKAVALIEGGLTDGTA